MCSTCTVHDLHVVYVYSCTRTVRVHVHVPYLYIHAYSTRTVHTYTYLRYGFKTTFVLSKVRKYYFRRAYLQTTYSSTFFRTFVRCSRTHDNHATTCTTYNTENIKIRTVRARTRTVNISPSAPPALRPSVSWRKCGPG